MNILRTVKDFFHCQREIRQMKRTLLAAKLMIEDLQEENGRLKGENIALKLGVMRKEAPNDKAVIDAAKELAERFRDALKALED